MARILVIVDCYLPSLKSGARLIHDLSIEFRRQGHDVTILTPSDAIPRSLDLSFEDGVNIIRVQTKKIKGTSRILRAIREMRLSAILWRNAKGYLLSNPHDLIIFYSPTIFFGTIVRRLKSHWSCPSYLILRDIFPQWAVDAKILRKGLVWWYFRKKEIDQYGAANFIGVECAANLKYFSDNFRDAGYRVEVLYNWSSTEAVSLPLTGYRRPLGLHGKVIFLYGGNLGVVQDLDNLVRLASGLKRRDDIRIVLIGEGEERLRLEKLIVEMNLPNIQILGPVQQEEYMSILAEADVGLISLDRRLKTHNLTGKLLGYLKSGKPVLASVNQGNDLFEILGRHKAGFCVLNGDDAGLCEAALCLADDAELRADLGKNARTLLEQLFSAEAAVRQIVRNLPGRYPTVAPASNEGLDKTVVSVIGN